MTTLTNLSTVNFVTDQKEMNVESALFNYFVLLYLSFGRDFAPDKVPSCSLLREWLTVSRDYI